MVPASVKSVLQGMEYTVKGYAILQETAFEDTRAKRKIKVPPTCKYICPNDVRTQLQRSATIPVL